MGFVVELALLLCIQFILSVAGGITALCMLYKYNKDYFSDNSNTNETKSVNGNDTKKESEEEDESDKNKLITTIKRLWKLIEKFFKSKAFRIVVFIILLIASIVLFLNAIYSTIASFEPPIISPISYGNAYQIATGMIGVVVSSCLTLLVFRLNRRVDNKTKTDQKLIKQEEENRRSQNEKFHRNELIAATLKDMTSGEKPKLSIYNNNITACELLNKRKFNGDDLFTFELNFDNKFHRNYLSLSYKDCNMVIQTYNDDTSKWDDNTIHLQYSKEISAYEDNGICFCFKGNTNNNSVKKTTDNEESTNESVEGNTDYEKITNTSAEQATNNKEAGEDSTEKVTNSEENTDESNKENANEGKAIDDKKTSFELFVLLASAPFRKPESPHKLTFTCHCEDQRYILEQKEENSESEIKSYLSFDMEVEINFQVKGYSPRCVIQTDLLECIVRYKSNKDKDKSATTT